MSGKFQRFLAAGILTGSLAVSNVGVPAAQAQLGDYCQSTVENITKKDKLRQAAFKGDAEAMKQYKAIVAKQAEQLKSCRQKNWPKNQAMWIRLYPCDVKPGVLEATLDRIVDRGYNQVNLEVFYTGQVLLPSSDNPTAWPSVLRSPGMEKTDLFAQALQKSRERGLKAYAWMYTLNFGYTYTLRPDRQQTVARNGKGQVGLSIIGNNTLNFEVVDVTPEDAFVDPYSPQARSDYLQMVKAILKRKPDGVLFDYVRYPKGVGSFSVATTVGDLWIYGTSSQTALLNRALNYKGQELIRRYLTKGFITVGDVAEVDRLYPQEREPMWEGRTPAKSSTLAPAAVRQPALQSDLWYLSAAHAVQGVVDFLVMASQPVLQQGIPAGAVFFPEGNQVIGQGFDSRLQAWDRFPAALEWHPMSYGVCGQVGCILSQIQRVLKFAPSGVKVKPVLAGIWGQPISNRPPLEHQMQALRQTAPQLNTISHFAFSWQEPGSDRQRKFCRL